MISEHDELNTVHPSAASVRVAAGSAVLVGVASMMIPLTGTDFDGRHLLGYMLGLLATGLLVTRTADLAARRGGALARVEARQAARHRRETGTWRRVAGSEMYATWMQGQRSYVVGGDLPAGVQPGPIGTEALRNVLLSMESGQWRPADDQGTRRIRLRLRLPDRPHLADMPGERES